MYRTGQTRILQESHYKIVISRKQPFLFDLKYEMLIRCLFLIPSTLILLTTPYTHTAPAPSKLRRSSQPTVLYNPQQAIPLFHLLYLKEALQGKGTECLTCHEEWTHHVGDAGQRGRVDVLAARRHRLLHVLEHLVHGRPLALLAELQGAQGSLSEGRSGAVGLGRPRSPSRPVSSSI